ncbi:MAG: hypothetical protein ABMA01_04390 [Chthoniobacteraceae bacterium]
MTTSEKNNLLKQNTLCWLAAIIPLLLHFSLNSTKFPWPMILPLIYVGLMLASNKLLSKASGETTDNSSR